MREPPVIDVIIPALNEENAVGLVVNDLPKSQIREIIVVDNGSADNTPQKAMEAGASVLIEERKGYGSACLKALDFIEKKEQKPDIIVFIDADYSDYPEQLPDLIQPIIKKDIDLVIGSRVLGKVEKGALTLPQRFGNALACSLMRMLYGYKFTDLGPFRAVKYDALRRLQMQDPDYGWTVEMQIKAAQLNLACEEVPVNYRKRIGVSKVSGTVKGVFLAGYKIIGLIFLYSLISWK
jgi:glycosyltransferase involved in cell wall biosynthesis